ncbi:MAG: hypothetical protein IKW71_00255 [Elusimicrobiaceae bacterium]|nr:hypothetical protein [Elusimicrobiaceae bacterium]
MNKLVTTPALDVFEHMALDETLVHECSGQVTLRFYNWVPGPALTFGYAQFVREVYAQAATQHFAGTFCRRPTGGGVVYHTDDLTFSLIFRAPGKPAEIYKNLHGAIHAALLSGGLNSQVLNTKTPLIAYAPSQHNQASACFANPVEHDVLAADGHKILGGAIRRFGDTVLYQGSLQLPQARQTPAYKQAIINAVRGLLAVDLKIQPLPVQLLGVARQLVKTQYNTAVWTEKF